MKCLWWAAFAAVVASPVLNGLGQQVTPPAAATAPATAPADASQAHPGKVIFSRSASDVAASPDVVAPEKTPETVAPSSPAATDAERQAITFLAYDLDVHLRPAEHALAVRAHLRIRNDSDRPLTRLPLQLSSSLHWSSMRAGNAPVAFSQSLVKSHIDHTGLLREAIVLLSHPLAPGETLDLDLTYEGTAALDATRLQEIGTPPDVAEATDWDRVAEDFVGLRGFGNVAWYPVSSVPVHLGEGAKYFTSIAAQRQRQSQALVSMQVTEEFLGDAPNLAVLDGQVFPLTPTSLPGMATVPGIVTCRLPATRLGFASPSLFLVTRTPQSGNGATVYARADDVANAAEYLSAAGMVAPLIHLWLGPTPHGDLSIVDLPEDGDAPFEEGTVLFTNVRKAAAENLANVLIHSLTHAYFRSPYPWLQEGVASFMTSLWLEQRQGRDFAIQQLDNERAALSLAEPGDILPDVAAEKQSLRSAREPVYYRTKADYVFWMLRDLAGDSALEQALRAYQPDSDANGTGFETVLERESGKDLKWFFQNWVNRDRGLPDFSIAGVYPNKAGLPGSYIVAVDVLNSGTAEAEVPVSVSSGTTTVTERLRIPARSRVSHRFLLQGQPAEVAVNDGTVPEVEASVHRQTLSVPSTPE